MSITQRLTRYPSGSVRELMTLAFPLMLTLFSGSLMSFCDRLFLGNYSLEALEGCVSAVALCILFQQPCMRITSMAQVFVGQYKGSRQWNFIGSCIWQMIWFSLLSMLITYPLSMLIERIYFVGTSVEVTGSIYFRTLMAVNFLFPLGSVLSSFFIGQGQTKMLIITSLSAQAINIILDYVLIFGIPTVLAPQGVFGAALATAIAQGFFCLFLFSLFMRKRLRSIFGTTNYAFNKDFFLQSMKIGVPRAVSRISVLACWAAITHIMIMKEDVHLLVVTIGSSLVSIFVFINESMFQAMITIASNLIGLKAWSDIWKLMRSACLFLMVTLLILSVPLIMYPNVLLPFFFKNPPSPEEMKALYQTCSWLWILFLGNGINSIVVSVITAAKDTTFHMLTNSLIWITTFPIIYFGIGKWDWMPDKFWLVVGFEAIIISSILFLRLQKEKWKTPSPLLTEMTKQPTSDA
jgi:multidrug resistance protein, MATE family